MGNLELVFNNCKEKDMQSLSTDTMIIMHKFKVCSNEIMNEIISLHPYYKAKLLDYDRLNPETFYKSIFETSREFAINYTKKKIKIPLNKLTEYRDIISGICVEHADKLLQILLQLKQGETYDEAIQKLVNADLFSTTYPIIGVEWKNPTLKLGVTAFICKPKKLYRLAKDPYGEMVISKSHDLRKLIKSYEVPEDKLQFFENMCI